MRDINLATDYNSSRPYVLSILILFLKPRNDAIVRSCFTDYVGNTKLGEMAD